MIILGPKVRVLGIRPEIVITLPIAHAIYQSQGETLRINSIVDGKHMRASLHYVGAAIDYDLPKVDPVGARNRLAEALGPNYDVVLEDTHIHVEWQPKVEL